LLRVGIVGGRPWRRLVAAAAVVRRDLILDRGACRLHPAAGARVQLEGHGIAGLGKLVHLTNEIADVDRAAVENVISSRDRVGVTLMAKPKAVTIYGIKNCDTMKKARAWLDAHDVAYAFHDYKATGIESRALQGWSRAVGWETLLNRAGTTFRKLSEADKAHLTEKKAIALMLAQPSMIKRPVLDVDGHLIVGFNPDTYAKTFA
jgi:arsenate reductase (glutaredoxin)